MLNVENVKRKVLMVLMAFATAVMFSSAASAQISFSNEDPADGSTVLSSDYMAGNIVASVDVANTNGNNMNVEFVNAADDSIYEIDYDVPPGGTAQMTSSGNTLRDNIFQTYNWYVTATDQVTGDTATSQTYTFDTTSPAAPSSSNVQPNEGAVFDAGSSSSFDVGFNWDVTGGDEDGTARLYVDGTEVYSQAFNAGESLSMSHTETVNLGSHSYKLVLDTGYYGELSQVTRSFTVEQDAAPDQPFNPDPADGSTVPVTMDDGSVVASVAVSQEDGNTMNVEFVNATDNSIMEIDYDVASGTRAQMTGSGNTFLDEPTTTYQWYARAFDQKTGKTTESPTFTVTTEDTQPVPPSNIQLVNPADAAVFNTNDSQYPVGFDFTVDSEEEPGNASIYLNGTQIFQEGFTASSSKSFTHDENLSAGTYEWYVETKTATYTNTSETRSFTVNTESIAAPEAPSNPIPSNGSQVSVAESDSDVVASVEVNQEDNNTMNVEFVNATDNSIMEIDYDVASGERAKMTGSGNTLRDELNKTYEWYARAFDQKTGKTTESGVFQFTTVDQVVKPDKPFDPEPENNSIVPVLENDGDIAASVKVTHPENTPMNVQFINASNGQIMEIDYNVESGERAKMTGIANTLRDKRATTYEWYAVAYDTETGEKTSSDIFQFTTDSSIIKFMEFIGNYWEAFVNNTGQTAQAFIGLVLMLLFGGIGYSLAGSTGGAISMILIIVVNSLAGLFPGWITLSLIILAVLYVFLFNNRSS